MSFKKKKKTKRKKKSLFLSWSIKKKYEIKKNMILKEKAQSFIS